MLNQEEMDGTTPSYRPLIAENWCQSKCQLVRHDFEWNIQQLAFLESPEKWSYSFSSSIFSAKEIPDFKWRLGLLDDGHSLKINLCPNVIGGTSRTSYPVRATVAILNQSRQKCLSRVHIVPVNSSAYVVFPLSKQQILDSGCLQMDKSLTVYCEIETLIYKGNESGVVTASSQPFICNGVDMLQNQLEEMFESMSLSDVTISVLGRDFQAHRNILAARSKVFAAMFTHETTEKLSGHVRIPDVEPDIFQQVLRFIYTGRLSLATLDQTMAIGLLVAADKYLLEQLKTECENLIVRRMSAENCVELFLLPDNHPAEHLKTFAVDYFRRFAAEVMATDDWMAAKQMNSSLCKILTLLFVPTA